MSEDIQAQDKAESDRLSALLVQKGVLEEQLKRLNAREDSLREEVYASAPYVKVKKAKDDVDRAHRAAEEAEEDRRALFYGLFTTDNSKPQISSSYGSKSNNLKPSLIAAINKTFDKRLLCSSNYEAIARKLVGEMLENDKTLEEMHEHTRNLLTEYHERCNECHRLEKEGLAKHDAEHDATWKAFDETRNEIDKIALKRFEATKETKALKGMGEYDKKNLRRDYRYDAESNYAQVLKHYHVDTSVIQ